MVASAKVAYLDRRSADYDAHEVPASVDMISVRERKRDLVVSFGSADERRIESAGVELLMGEASFPAPKKLEVLLNGGELIRLAADIIFINVGARPGGAPVEGLEDVPALDSTSIMELDAVPDHLLTPGGGYVGLEFAQMFRRFGSAVTIVQRGKQLLSPEDADVAEAVAEILRQDGVEVLLETQARRDEQDDGGRIQVTIETPTGTQAPRLAPPGGHGTAAEHRDAKPGSGRRRANTAS